MGTAQESGYVDLCGGRTGRREHLVSVRRRLAGAIRRVRKDRGRLFPKWLIRGQREPRTPTDRRSECYSVTGGVTQGEPSKFIGGTRSDGQRRVVSRVPNTERADTTRRLGTWKSLQEPMQPDAAADQTSEANIGRNGNRMQMRKCAYDDVHVLACHVHIQSLRRCITIAFTATSVQTRPGTIPVYTGLYTISLRPTKRSAKTRKSRCHPSSRMTTWRHVCCWEQAPR